jgi:hypothetical protein
MRFRRLHRRLPRKSRRQYRLDTAVSAKLTIRFQRTVNDVLALKSVNDVLALITYILDPISCLPLNAQSIFI